MIRPQRVTIQVGLTLVLLLAAQSGVGDSIRIMPAGDSDVEGVSGFVSFRYDLWFLLSDAGYDVDFVGRFGGTGGGVDASLYPRYQEMDTNHESSVRTGSSDLASSATLLAGANRPDVILTMTSVDICELGSVAPSAVRRNLRDFINRSRAVDPEIHFLLGQSYDWIFDHCHPDGPQIIPQYNAQIAELAAEMDSAQSRVLAVDHYTGFDRDSMFSLQLRSANRTGEMFMAQNWFEALKEVIPLVGADTFSISAGLNDAWYHPATAGQGFFLTVYEDIPLVFLAWFTFDTERPSQTVTANLGEPGHRWLTAQGPFDGNRAVLDVFVSEGGVFDSGEPQPGTRIDGMMELIFEDCSAGIVNYEIDSLGLQGSIPIQRVANDNLALCEVLSAEDP
jgi:hypothetical protein